MEGLGINGPFLIAQIVNIVVLYVLLKRVLYAPVLNMLETRREKIRESLAAAETARAEAANRGRENEEIVAKAHVEARQIVQRAEESAKRREADILAKAQQEAGAVSERERQQIAYERQQAMSQLRDEVARLSLDIARRTVSASLINESAHSRIVNEVLEEAGVR